MVGRHVQIKEVVGSRWVCIFTYLESFTSKCNTCCKSSNISIQKHIQKLKPGLNFQALYLREPSSDLSEKLLSRFCGQAKTQPEDLMRAAGEAAIKSCTSFSLCSE